MGRGDQADCVDFKDRRANLDSALASFGMEGLAPDAETSAILESYAAGQLGLEAAGAAIESHVAEMRVKDTFSGAA